MNGNSLSAYGINHMFLLGLQYNGLGYDNSKSLCGFLGLRCPWAKKGYHKLELQVGQILIPMVDDILLANLLEEIASSPVRRDDGSVDFAASFDMAWQKRSSGNAYDSTSGHAFMVGALNKKIIGMIVMAKVCAFCRAWDKKHVDCENCETPHNTPNHNCSRNHTGSSKSMEPKAGVLLLEEIYMRGKVPIYTLIGDDDSTLTANMRHSWKARIDANQMDATEWPRGNPTASNPRGAKKPDHGCLPLHVPEVKIELADPTHRCKVVCKHLFNYASKAKSINTCGLTNQDCQRLKTNYGYFTKTNRHLHVDDVVKNAPSIYNDHFNDHSGCGKGIAITNIVFLTIGTEDCKT